MRLDGETVFVTGAGAGIGEAIARRCAEEGAFVVVTDVDEAGAEATAAELEAAAAHRLDVTDGDRVHELVDEVAAEHGLDVMVNNAGIGHPPAVAEAVDTAVFEHVLDVNVRGVWHGTQAALPHLKEQGSGSVVNVASLAALYGLPRQAVYSLTKAAVLNFTRAVAAEAGRDGVRANAVCPGFVDTELGRAYFQHSSDPEAARERMLEQYPLGRLGEPGEVADAVVFLASEEASWITGHGLVIDGGFSAT
jgi:NAD(P)-dependent dehydrogenase (short-subunit alcohol dehydrogenase family)